MNLAIQTNALCKRYTHFQLEKVDLSVEQGTVMGLIGPNGAGKSTIMRILNGLIMADSGTAKVLGFPIPERAADAKREVGYYSEDMRLYGKESIAWHMQLVRSIYPKWDEQYAQQLLDRFGLIKSQRIKGLSHGQRVKAHLLLVFARHPQLLILDEPTTGLDPVARHEVMSELMRVVEDETRTVLFSSHNTQDVEQICDAITFVDRGMVIASQNRDDFVDLWRRIRLQVPQGWQMPSLPGVKLEVSFRNLRTLSHSRYDNSISHALKASGAEVEAVEKMTLEEIFVSSVMRGRDGESL
jgi:ABC-2 type transport system ATP-binding protein